MKEDIAIIMTNLEIVHVDVWMDVPGGCQKRVDRSREQLIAASSNVGKGYYLVNSNSGHRFLCDSGASVSIFPACSADRTQVIPENTPTLVSATGAVIKTYGYRNIPLRFNGRSYSWRFVLADVKVPLLGADFLAHYGLLVDLKNKQLIDSSTFMSMPLLSQFSPQQTTVNQIFSGEASFRRILDDFPKVTRPETLTERLKTNRNQSHGIFHHIETTGPPVFCRPRRLSPEKLAIAKREFDAMLNMGVIRPSKSPWSSPLHIVPKSNPNNGPPEWRPCGDFRRLNAATKPDRYPVPLLTDFTSKMHGATIFSKLDILKAFWNIPLDKESIEKTAISTPFGLYEFVVMASD